MLYLRLLVAALFASVRARRDLVLENLALRHQLAVYTRGRRRPRLRRHDRRLWSLLARGWSGWRGTLVMVEPDTVVRWHRSAWRAYWRWKSCRRSGRPRTPAVPRKRSPRTSNTRLRYSGWRGRYAAGMRSRTMRGGRVILMKEPPVRREQREVLASIKLVPRGNPASMTDRCFNPRPARRPGAAALHPPQHGGVVDVSILARPEGRALRPRARARRLS